MKSLLLTLLFVFHFASLFNLTEPNMMIWLQSVAPHTLHLVALCVRQRPSMGFEMAPPLFCLQR